MDKELGTKCDENGISINSVTIINEILSYYEIQMTGWLEKQRLATIVAVENEHKSTNSVCLQRFQEQLPDHSSETKNLLQQRILMSFQGLLTNANIQAEGLVEIYSNVCSNNMAFILRNLDSTFAEMCSDAHKYVANLKKHLQKWLDLAIKNIIDPTIAKRENIDKLLQVLSEQPLTVSGLEVHAILSGISPINVHQCQELVMSHDEGLSEIVNADSWETIPERWCTLAVPIADQVTLPVTQLNSQAEVPFGVNVKPNGASLRADNPKPRTTAPETLSSPEETNMDFSVHNRNPFHSTIVFQYTSNCIQMGCIQYINPTCSRLTILKNEFGHLSTSTRLGLTNNGLLLYGPQIDEAGDEILGEFTPETIMINNLNRPVSPTVVIYGMQVFLTPELMLGFLLKKLKKTVEYRSHNLYSKAVIVVPYTLPSAQRIQLKDAARIAGFGEVNLLNDISSAAYFFAKTGGLVTVHVPQVTISVTSTKLIILTENSGNIECALYSIEKCAPNNDLIKMLAYRRKNWIEPFNAQRSQTKAQVIAKLATEMIRETVPNLPEDNYSAASFINILVTNLEYPVPEDNFRRVGLELARKKILGTYTGPVPNETEAILKGATLLAENLDSLGIYVKDQINFQLSKLFTAQEGDQIFPLTESEQITIPACFLPQRGNNNSLKVEFFMDKVHRESMVYSTQSVASDINPGNQSPQISVGYLKMKWMENVVERQNFKGFVPIFKINHEGIVSLDGVKAISNCICPIKRKLGNRDAGITQRQDCELIGPNDKRILWKTDNLERDEIQTYKELLANVGL